MGIKKSDEEMQLLVENEELEFLSINVFRSQNQKQFVLNDRS